MKRLKEPSTWAALAALAALFGGAHAGQYADIITALGGVAAAAGVLVPEQKAVQ